MNTITSRRIGLLQAMPIFGAIREELLQFLLERSCPTRRDAGELFFQEHQEASSMFVLESGRASVFKSWEGREVVLHELEAGDCFGEMALMDLCPRSASVRADEACEAIELTAAHLHALFERDAEQFTLIQMNIGREVCRRLRHADELLFRAQLGKAHDDAEPIYSAWAS